MSAVDEGLTLPEKQALEFQAIAKVYLTAPDHRVDQDVLAVVDSAVRRMRKDPRMDGLFRQWEES